MFTAINNTPTDTLKTTPTATIYQQSKYDYEQALSHLNKGEREEALLILFSLINALLPVSGHEEDNANSTDGGDDDDTKSTPQTQALQKSILQLTLSILLTENVGDDEDLVDAFECAMVATKAFPDDPCFWNYLIVILDAAVSPARPRTTKITRKLISTLSDKQADTKSTERDCRLECLILLLHAWQKWCRLLPLQAHKHRLSIERIKQMIGVFTNINPRSSSTLLAASDNNNCVSDDGGDHGTDHYCDGAIVSIDCNNAITITLDCDYENNAMFTLSQYIALIVECTKKLLENSENTASIHLTPITIISDAHRKVNDSNAAAFSSDANTQATMPKAKKKSAASKERELSLKQQYARLWVQQLQENCKVGQFPSNHPLQSSIDTDTATIFSTLKRICADAQASKMGEKDEGINPPAIELHRLSGTTHTFHHHHRNILNILQRESARFVLDDYSPPLCKAIEELTLLLASTDPQYILDEWSIDDCIILCTLCVEREECRVVCELTERLLDHLHRHFSRGPQYDRPTIGGANQQLINYLWLTHMHGNKERYIERYIDDENSPLKCIKSILNNASAAATVPDPCTIYTASKRIIISQHTIDRLIEKYHYQGIAIASAKHTAGDGGARTLLSIIEHCTPKQIARYCHARLPQARPSTNTASVHKLALLYTIIIINNKNINNSTLDSVSDNSDGAVNHSSSFLDNDWLQCLAACMGSDDWVAAMAVFDDDRDQPSNNSTFGDMLAQVAMQMMSGASHHSNIFIQSTLPSLVIGGVLAPASSALLYEMVVECRIASVNVSLLASLYPKNSDGSDALWLEWLWLYCVYCKTGSSNSGSVGWSDLENIQMPEECRAPCMMLARVRSDHLPHSNADDALQLLKEDRQEALHRLWILSLAINDNANNGKPNVNPLKFPLFARTTIYNAHLQNVALTAATTIYTNHLQTSKMHFPTTATITSTIPCTLLPSLPCLRGWAWCVGVLDIILEGGCCSASERGSLLQMQLLLSIAAILHVDPRDGGGADDDKSSGNLSAASIARDLATYTQTQVNKLWSSSTQHNQVNVISKHATTITNLLAFIHALLMIEGSADCDLAIWWCWTAVGVVDGPLSLYIPRNALFDNDDDAHNHRGSSVFTHIIPKPNPDFCSGGTGDGAQKEYGWQMLKLLDKVDGAIDHNNRINGDTGKNATSHKMLLTYYKALAIHYTTAHNALNRKTLAIVIKLLLDALEIATIIAANGSGSHSVDEGAAVYHWVYGLVCRIVDVMLSLCHPNAPNINNSNDDSVGSSNNTTSLDDHVNVYIHKVFDKVHCQLAKTSIVASPPPALASSSSSQSGLVQFIPLLAGLSSVSSILVAPLQLHYHTLLIARIQTLAACTNSPNPSFTPQTAIDTLATIIPSLIKPKSSLLTTILNYAAPTTNAAATTTTMHSSWLPTNAGNITPTLIMHAEQAIIAAAIVASKWMHGGLEWLELACRRVGRLAGSGWLFRCRWIVCVLLQCVCDWLLLHYDGTDDAARYDGICRHVKNCVQIASKLRIDIPHALSLPKNRTK